jgi:cardiolipin synthase
MEFLQFLSDQAWWELALMLIGILAIITALTSLFSSFGHETPTLYATGIPPVNTKDFLISLSRLVNREISRGGTVEVLQNGDEFLKRFLADIHAAKKHIHLTNYIFGRGVMLKQITQALQEKVRQGVEVRLLIDAFGGKKAPNGLLRDLEREGAKVAYFRPFVLGKLLRYHRRNHRRAMVIDGRVAYTGGLAFDDRWLGNADSIYIWRDTMFRFTGGIVHDVQGSFAQLWVAVTGEILSGREKYPYTDIHADQDLTYVHLSSSPSDDTQPLDKFLWLILSAARERIYITNYSFILDTAVRRAVIERAHAGIDVQVLLPGVVDNPVVRFASHSYYGDFLSAGIKIHEYQRAMLHNKIMVVDDCLSVIGSYNLDIRSKKWNEEIVFAIQDSQLADTLVRAFRNDLVHSKEVTARQWDGRSVFRRGMERIAVLFSEQL